MLNNLTKTSTYYIPNGFLQVELDLSLKDSTKNLAANRYKYTCPDF